MDPEKVCPRVVTVTEESLCIDTCGRCGQFLHFTYCLGSQYCSAQQSCGMLCVSDQATSVSTLTQHDTAKLSPHQSRC